MRIVLAIFITLIFLYNTPSIGMQRGGRWKGRAVPISYTSGKWHILFGHNARENTWGDFAEESKRGERGDTVAARALAAQTNGLYALSLRGTVWLKWGDDIIHVVPVQFISGKELYERARNTIKDDFVWISLDDFLAGRGLERVRNAQRKKHPFDPVVNFLRQELPKIIAQLPIPGQTPPVQPPVPSVPSTPVNVDDWRAIPEVILFYTKGKPYYEFTNFFEGHPVFLKNKWWPTTEHYYQAQKFVGSPTLEERIRSLRTAREAFDEAKANRASVRPDWQKVNLNVMIEAVLDKFSRYPNLKNLLLGTGDKVIAEDSPTDDFFGIHTSGTGKNHLGQILMYVRDILRGAAVKPYEWRPASYYLAQYLAKSCPVSSTSTSAKEGLLETYLAQLTNDLTALKGAITGIK